MKKSRKHYTRGPEVLSDMVENATAILQEGGLSDEDAAGLALAVVEKMASLWGGSLIYFPKGNWNGRSPLWFQLAERDWNIFREFDGTNRDEVCKKYGIKRSRFYKIVAACRHEMRERNPIESA